MRGAERDAISKRKPLRLAMCREAGYRQPRSGFSLLTFGDERLTDLPLSHDGAMREPR